MSVAEIVPRDGGFERTPPHDLAAEQCVLGGMLLSKDAISDVLESIKSHDFYRPAHQLVYDVILDLYGRGEPADAVTVAAELTKRGDIGRMGGAPYLHTLIASVPTAANAGYYAKIVRERAILRRLVEVGTRIVQLGYAGDGDADELVDMAEAEIYGVTDRRVSEDYLPLSAIMPGALDEIEAIGSKGGSLTGVPTGFSDLDALTNGLHPGQMVVIAARPAIGKALAQDTPLPTPTGWTTMGQVQRGDLLLGEDGRPTRVTEVTEILQGRPCYEIEFSDGTVIVADGQHLWRTTTRASRRQASENLRARYWPDAAMARLRSAYRQAVAEPDRLISHKEAVAQAGPEFKNVLRTVERAIETGAREQTAKVHYFSRRQLLGALLARAERYKSQGIMGTHPQTHTTTEIAASLRCVADGRLNHAVTNARPLDLPEADLPIEPYTLGAWLGDGTSASAGITSADEEIRNSIRLDGCEVRPHGRLLSTIRAEPERQRRIAAAMTLVRTYGATIRQAAAQFGIPELAAYDRMPSPVGRGHAANSPLGGDMLLRYRPLQSRLRILGLQNNKHIPALYQRASITQRRALLAGLLDADGYRMQQGTVIFAVTSRQLARDVRELICGLGYTCTVQEKPVRGRSADTSVSYAICFTPREEMLRLSRKRARQHLWADGRRREDRRTIVDVRPVPSVPVRCVQVDSDAHMYLAGRTMIPTHNSTLALDLARAASVKAGLTSVIFSLEMSRNEITMRLLSAEARVPLSAMRTGQLGDDDWTRLARRMSEVVDAPLFIDDSPNMSMMEIRSKCRRLKQRHDLRLVIVDYLQLMSSPRRVENRQQEVSDLSRSLKLLAKELDVPVVAVAQLNRGPEQRTDKKPLLSDLRESGCLTASTRIVRADTNAEESLGDLLANGATDIPVWALDERLRYVKARMSHVFPTGRRETFLLRMASGRQIEATGNHRFLTLDGWVPLAELDRGARIAVPRALPPPAQPQQWPDAEVILLAHMLGDGSFVRRQPIRYASVDEECLSAVASAAQHFGICAVRDEYPQARVTTLRLPAPFKPARGKRNPVAEWLDELGLYGLRSHEKFVPAAISGLPDRQVALFLRHLWATDGSVTVHGNGRGGRIYYASTSRRLADDVASLLRRFGINGRIRSVSQGQYRPAFTVDVSGHDEQLTFLRDIGAHGARSELCRKLASVLSAARGNTDVDTIPAEVWQRVRQALTDQRMSHRVFAAALGTQFCGSTLVRHAPSRQRLSKVAAVLGDADLDLLATNDVLWDEVAAIEPLGIQDVYDATVVGLHNFIADGIAVHNSIEQDSDVVILLHREDFYERESSRAGEADFIVAKHRNGPTMTVTVAFQGHYSRFVDMAPI